MDLSTRFLGLGLKNPIVASSSPLTWDLDSALALEDAGVAAIIMPSLFEEQIEQEQGGAAERVGALREELEREKNRLEAEATEAQRREAVLESEMMQAADSAGDPWLTSFALYAASLSWLDRGDYAEAQRLAEALRGLAGHAQVPVRGGHRRGEARRRPVRRVLAHVR